MTGPLPTRKVHDALRNAARAGEPAVEFSLHLGRSCGGLGYTAAACLKGGARQILSCEKNEGVIWLRSLNPWSPEAGELYSQAFYGQLARVLKRKRRLFHHTGTPNKLTTGRDVPNEVAKRLRKAGFATALNGDGVLATKG